MTLALGLALALVQPTAKEPLVGRVIVIGNTVTAQQIILNTVGLEPGERYVAAELRTAELRLAYLGIFRAATVTSARDPGNPAFHDIIVSVVEGGSSGFRVMGGWNRAATPVVSLVWEERNFDLWNPPSSLDACTEGRAFRGVGQLFRVELLQVPLLPHGSVRFLQWGSVLAGF